MTSAELDEYEAFIVPLSMMEKLEVKRGRMTPKQVLEYVLAATGDREIAELEWQRQVDAEMQRERE